MTYPTQPILRLLHTCFTFTSIDACGRRPLAVKLPVKLPRSARAHKSRTAAAPFGVGSPSSAKEHETSPTAEPRLSSSAATEPSASGRAQHSGPVGAAGETRVPCTPSASWSTAMTSGAVRISIVAASTPETRSLEMSSGAATTHHAAKWERASSGERPV